MTQGITLIAIGGHGYLRWAINMACSIKHHSPDVAIQLIVSKALAEEAQSHTKLFNDFTVLEDDDFQDDSGRLFPAKLKTRLYEFLIYDETIYLDVDGCIIKDIKPLFGQSGDLVTDVQGVYDLTQGERFEACKWAKPDTIWFHFGLHAKAKLPAINSSFLFIRKSEQNKKLFELAHELLMTNPLPIEQHWHVWGHRRAHKVSQPDELYINVAMAMLGIIPEHEVAIYFRLITDKGDELTLADCREKYYGVGLFGQLESNHKSSRRIYDGWMQSSWRNIMGTPYETNAETLSKTKFAVI